MGGQEDRILRKRSADEVLPTLLVCSGVAPLSHEADVLHFDDMVKEVSKKVEGPHSGMEPDDGVTRALSWGGQGRHFRRERILAFEEVELTPGRYHAETKALRRNGIAQRLLHFLVLPVCSSDEVSGAREARDYLPVGMRRHPRVVIVMGVRNYDVRDLCR